MATGANIRPSTADGEESAGVRRAPRFIARAAILLALLVAGIGLASPSAAHAQSEEGIKAAFIYNFAKFTTWPAGAFADANAPLTVGFVGADSIADLFEKNVAGKNANGRDFAIKRLTGATGAENCQIVFVGDPDQAAAVFAALKGKPVLSIGSSDGFIAAGGTVNFIKDGAKITFDLNLDAGNSAKLTLDARLLQLARNKKQ
jgi:hypothetical protein